MKYFNSNKLFSQLIIGSLVFSLLPSAFGESLNVIALDMISKEQYKSISAGYDLKLVKSEDEELKLIEKMKEEVKLLSKQVKLEGSANQSDMDQNRQIRISVSLERIVILTEHFKRHCEALRYELNLPEKVTLFKMQETLADADMTFGSAMVLQEKCKYSESFVEYIDAWKQYKRIQKDLDLFLVNLEAVEANPKGDFDADGLPNAYEIEAFNGVYDPTKAESDFNGIDDGKDDYDLDGLNNIKEMELGTSPIYNDTDEDGITDDREIERKTDPLSIDSDGDGIADGDEYVVQAVKLEGLPVELKINAPGDVTDIVRVTDIAKEILFKDTKYMVAPIFDIQCLLPNQGAEITIPIDKSKIPDGDFSKVKMVYFDEELMAFIPLENQTIDVVSGKVTGSSKHLSIFTVLNVPNWSQLWNVPLNEGLVEREKQESVDFMFIMDSSGSMDVNDPMNHRIKGVQSFVEGLITNGEAVNVKSDKVAIVDFDESAKLLVPLTEKFDEIKSAIAKVDSYGGTNISAGISLANSELISKSAQDRRKVEILITDGDGDFNESLLKQAKENNISIYTIGIGEGISVSLLKKISFETKGRYYHVDHAKDIPDVLKHIRKTIQKSVDTDGDGLPDSVEINGMRIGTSSEVLVFTDPKNPDTDGDGIKDGVEIDGPFEYPTNREGFYRLLSNPNKLDSDGDGLEDAIERHKHMTNPLMKDTDSDGLTDYEEINKYQTNPRSADTDEDTFTDYYEVFGSEGE